jgi:hypothetical protein
MATITDLHDLCVEFLSACEEALATVPGAGAGFLGVPDRSYVHPGIPAADCEQLTVHVEQIIDANTGLGGLESGTRHRSARMPQPILVATLFRCVPGPDNNGDPPAAADLESAAQQLHADGWALHNVLFNKVRDGTLLEICSNVVWEGLRRYGPQGGFGGWTLVVRPELDGYQS